VFLALRISLRLLFILVALALNLLKGFFERALTILPQFSFYSKPGTPSKETEDGDKTVQGERIRELIGQI
jgi:hypothetical protein